MSAQPVSISLSVSMSIPGGLHIVANLVHGMLTQLTHSHDYCLPLLSALSSFLHNPWSRERFTVTCCSSGHAQRYVRLFETFPHTLVGWRWDSACRVIRDLWMLENHCVSFGMRPRYTPQCLAAVWWLQTRTRRRWIGSLGAHRWQQPTKRSLIPSSGLTCAWSLCFQTHARICGLDGELGLSFTFVQCEQATCHCPVEVADTRTVLPACWAQFA